MKVERGGYRMLRREQLMTELVEDSYREKAKMPDPARCSKCGATYLKGRWTWRKAPADAALHKCPACQRIADDYPAGYVILKGPFLPTHRREILNLVKTREARAKSEHPLQRIMAVEPREDGIIVTTTDSHLARNIAQAVHEAFKGELDFSYNKSENLLRATWSR